MQEVACRTRKTEETLSNSFLNAHLRLCSRGKLYVLRVRLFEYTSVHSVPRSNRRESSSAWGRNKVLADFSVLEIGGDGDGSLLELFLDESLDFYIHIYKSIVKIENFFIIGIIGNDDGYFSIFISSIPSL